MATITIDGREVECRDGVTVLRAALEAGWDVPHYCYHPGMSVVASCRLCLMEMMMPNPQTGEMGWAPKLFPSCQTPVRNGMVVRFDSPKVHAAREQAMEYFLLNHPLDCPVCDQAGECWLQDYSLRFGRGHGRMLEAKHVNPKKNIGPRTLLYQDRCVLCSRCVRFCAEISGTRELCIVNRGHRCEIDVFEGMALDNKLQGNVVDICPVGALLDKDFLMQQRVWELQSAKSICPVCSAGCNIRIDHNNGQVWRLKPRYNDRVNDWWMCDDGRFGYKFIHDPRRLTRPQVRRGSRLEPIAWPDVPQAVRFRLTQAVQQHGGRRTAAVLSPMMSCEEAWLLARFIREVAPEARLVLGHVPLTGDDEHFPVGCEPDDAKFTIRAEKCPNRRGVERVLQAAGGPTMDFQQFVEQAGAGELSAAWVVGGYPNDWLTDDLAAAVQKLAWLAVQDIFPGKLIDKANVVLPACSWAEREGSFVNHAGLLQVFERAIRPPDGAQIDGQYLFELADFAGVYSGRRVREIMARQDAGFSEVVEATPEPAFAH